MMNQYQLSKSTLSTLQQLSQSENHPLIRGLLKGVEKEGLRVTPQGSLAQTRHHLGLGSALTHPQITTDFSEALLEFITAPTHLNHSTLEDLTNLHSYSYEHVNDELIWPISMPGKLPADNDIPVALYGSSNRAKMKTIYREGLGLRYGRTMQTVAGLHYNFSLPRSFWAFLHQQELSSQSLEAFITDKYFHLIRNFRRYYWLLIYLLGASPTVDASFVKNRKHNLSSLSKDTLGLPYATSLRMGDLGYQSNAQSKLFVCYNALSTYTATLNNAIQTPYAAYENLATSNAKQLNTSLLQIENEFYSPIRPKRTAHTGETALTALCKRGVEYLEIRCLDLDPFESTGISRDTIRLLDTFLLYCLFLPSPACDAQEFSNTAKNQRAVVTEGRKPNLTLIENNNIERPMREWAFDLLEAMAPVAQLFDDAAHQDGSYACALESARQRVASPERLPSAQIMKHITNGMSHVEFGLKQANIHKATFLSNALSPLLSKRYSDTAAQSLQQQKEEDMQTQEPFEQYLADYYKQYADCCTEHA